MPGVLVTGASGFLGGAVVRSLSGTGWRVVATGRDHERLAAVSGANVTCVALDHARDDHNDLRTVCRGLDAVVHCAALSSPCGPARAFDAANVHVTRKLVEFAADLGIRCFVHVSSPSIYTAMRDRPAVREDADLPSPVNHYARTKAAAESIVMAAPDLAPIVLRPRAIYGKGDRSLLPRLLRAAARGPLPLIRDGIALTDPTHVDDVVAAIRAALDAPAGLRGVFNVSGGEPVRVTELADRAARRVGLTPRWRTFPLPVASTLANAMEWTAAVLPGQPEPPLTRFGVAALAYTLTLDIARAARQLGWAPRISLEEGLNRTFGDTP